MVSIQKMAFCWAELYCFVLMCSHLKYSIMYFRIMSERSQCMWTRIVWLEFVRRTHNQFSDVRVHFIRCRHAFEWMNDLPWRTKQNKIQEYEKGALMLLKEQKIKELIIDPISIFTCRRASWWSLIFFVVILLLLKNKNTNAYAMIASRNLVFFYLWPLREFI